MARQLHFSSALRIDTPSPFSRTDAQHLTSRHEKLVFLHWQLWLTLAEQHLLRNGVDWSEVERNCFNERINPDDEELGQQIVRV